jgi:hypothetical protein
MATKHHPIEDEDDENGREPAASSASSRSRSRRRSSSAATQALSAATILDIVERLGLIDMIVDRIKARVDEVDADQLIDDIADYLRKNPEVLVVALGAVTIASGALVYLNRRK